MIPIPRAGTTVLVGVVGFLMVIVIVIGLEVLYHRTADAERYRKVVAEESVELRRVEADQQKLLRDYRWVDEAQGVVAVPIERAMELIVEESR